MPLQIVLTLGNSPATERVSLIAECTRERRGGQTSRPLATKGFLGGLAVTPCFVWSVNPACWCCGFGERKCGMRFVASGMCVQDCALGYTHCAIR